MTSDIAAAMRRATELTRAFNLTEATNVIQAALMGRKSTTPAEAFRGLPLTARLDCESQPRRPRQRILPSLGDAVQALREGRALLELPAAERPVVMVPDGAQFLARSFACEAGSRHYRLFVPATAAGPPRGLIVMLHGCRQNPEDFAVGTRMNDVAARSNLIVAYPSQPMSANAAGCWNWFAPAHQLRDRGEPAILAGMTRHLMQEFDFNRDQVFVAGLSAGGAMAAVMVETYPDLFCGAGIHSGLAYRSAYDVASAFSTMGGNAKNTGAIPHIKRPYPIRTIIFQGDADKIVHPNNARRIIGGLIDPEWAVAMEDGETDGLAFSKEVYTNREDSIELWSIADAGHAWSGGDPDGSYASPSGPDASAEIVRFFLR
jgi:poly(hydroxyalkanoate) depolymerase family esterase